MKNAVIMSRVSSDEQAKGYSLDVQLNQLTNHCKKNNICVVKHFKKIILQKILIDLNFKNFLSTLKKTNKL